MPDPNHVEAESELPRGTAAADGPDPVLREWLGFAGFYTCSFAVLGVYMQFFPAWLHDVQGFGKQDIAVILSAQTISRTLAGPLWSQWVDRSGDARRVLLLLASGAVGAFVLFAWAPTLLIAFCVAFAFGCLYPPMHPIVDAAAVDSGARLGFSFGRLRMVGSLSFLVVILIVGSYLERAGSSRVFPIVLVLLLVTAGAAALVPRRAAEPRESTPRTPWWQLFRSGPFVLLLLSAALIQGSHATYYNLSTVYWNEHGIGKSMAAVLWAEGVLAEIVLLFVAKHTIERWRPTTLLLLGGLGAAVRWSVVASTTSIPLLLASNWLHAFSFAATYLGAIRALENRVPRHQRATAQGLLGAASAGGGMVVCGLVGGFAFERIGGGAFFVMAGFALVGVVLALALRWQRGQLR